MTILVWLDAHTKHIGLYPQRLAMSAFERELAEYNHAKGSVQFPRWI